MKKVLLFLLMLMFNTMAACNGQIGESFMHIYDLSVRVDEDKDITVHTNLDDVSRIEYEVLGKAPHHRRPRLWGGERRRRPRESETRKTGSGVQDLCGEG